MKTTNKEPVFINLPSEDKLNLKEIKFLFTEESSKVCFVHEINQFYRCPFNNNIIGKIYQNVELFIVSNDYGKLGSYYIAPDSKTVKYGLQKAETERQVQIANEFNASKVIASTQELEGVVQFSDKLIDLAIKQLNNARVKL